MSIIIKLGVDNGNYNTKSSERMSYLSGLDRSDREFITPDMTVCYDKTYYAIGDKRMAFQQDKTKSDDTFILTLPSIAHAMKQAGTRDADIILGVGLPIDVYSAQKAAFREYFLRGEVEFFFENVPYHCRIADCKVFAQGHAALCKYYMTFKNYTGITVVDIGGYTVDVLPVKKGKIDHGNCLSLRQGTITLFHRIQKELQSDNILLSDELLTEAIHGHIEHSEKDHIEAVIEKQMQIYVQELLNALRERGFDLRLPLLFVGGGAELLGVRLYTKELTTTSVLDRFANAEGYKLLLG